MSGVAAKGSVDGLVAIHTLSLRCCAASPLTECVFVFALLRGFAAHRMRLCVCAVARLRRSQNAGRGGGSNSFFLDPSRKRFAVEIVVSLNITHGSGA